MVSVFFMNVPNHQTIYSWFNEQSTFEDLFMYLENTTSILHRHVRFTINKKIYTFDKSKQILIKDILVKENNSVCVKDIVIRVTINNYYYENKYKEHTDKLKTHENKSEYIEFLCNEIENMEPLCYYKEKLICLLYKQYDMFITNTIKQRLIYILENYIQSYTYLIRYDIDYQKIKTLNQLKKNIYNII